MTLRMLIALTHEGANRRWCTVEDRDLQLFNDRPPAIPCGRIGRTFVHHLRCTVAERAVDDVAVSGHPTNVGGAPVDVVGLDVEDGAMREGGAEQVASAGVHDPLWLRRGAARVEQVEQLFGGHRIGWALRGLAWNELVPPVVAAGLHRRGARGAWLTTLIDEHAGNGSRVLERLVSDRLQLEEVPLAIPTVGGDQHLRRGIVDAVGECIRRKAAEHHAVRSAEAGAGEHGDRHLRDHRHINGHAVALGDAERLQGVGGLLHLSQQIVVGHGATVARLTDPVEGDLLATASGNVPIDAVLRHVELTVIKPLREWELPLQGLREGRTPGQQFACLFGPEGNRIGSSAIVEIGAGIGCCCGCHVRREGESLRLEGFNPLLLRCVAH